MPVRKIGGKWKAEVRIHQRFSTKGQARHFEKRVRATLAKLRQAPLDDKPCCSIRDKLEEFLTDRLEGAGHRPCNEDTAELHRKRLLRFDRVFHSKPIDAIARAEVEAWRNRRRRTMHNGRRIQRDTVNAELRSLYAFAKWAQKKDYAPPNLPLLSVGLLWEPKKVTGYNRKPVEILPIDQLVDVIERITMHRREVGLFLAGMFLYMLRPANVWRLRRMDVRLPVGKEAGKLRVVGLKGGHDRTLPILPGSRGHAWVKECLELGGSEAKPSDPLLLCAGSRNRENPNGWTTSAIDQAVAQACEELGIDFPFTPYTIRHSSIAWLHTLDGISLANVRTAAAHSKITTQEFYAHVTAGEGATVFAHLDRVYGGLKQPGGGS